MSILDYFHNKRLENYHTLNHKYSSLQERVNYILQHDLEFLTFNDLIIDDIVDDIKNSAKIRETVYFPCEQKDSKTFRSSRKYIGEKHMRCNENDLRQIIRYDKGIVDYRGRVIRR